MLETQTHNQRLYWYLRAIKAMIGPAAINAKMEKHPKKISGRTLPNLRCTRK
jgi:hypothetical protein